MQVMVIMKATEESEAGVLPSRQTIEEVVRYNEELTRAGILLAADGLAPSSRGARIEFSGTRRHVVDGPFTETKELVAGYWIFQVESLAQAIEWARRYPNPDGKDGVLEIRPMWTPEDLGDAITPEIQERVRRMEEQAAASARR